MASISKSGKYDAATFQLGSFKVGRLPFREMDRKAGWGRDLRSISRLANTFHGLESEAEEVDEILAFLADSLLLSIGRMVGLA